MDIIRSYSTNVICDLSLKSHHDADQSLIMRWISEHLSFETKTACSGTNVRLQSLWIIQGRQEFLPRYIANRDAIVTLHFVYSIKRYYYFFPKILFYLLRIDRVNDSNNNGFMPVKIDSSLQLTDDEWWQLGDSYNIAVECKVRDNLSGRRKIALELSRGSSYSVDNVMQNILCKITVYYSRRTYLIECDESTRLHLLSTNRARMTQSFSQKKLNVATISIWDIKSSFIYFYIFSCYLNTWVINRKNDLVYLLAIDESESRYPIVAYNSRND